MTSQMMNLTASERTSLSRYKYLINNRHYRATTRMTLLISLVIPRVPLLKLYARNPRLKYFLTLTKSLRERAYKIPIPLKYPSLATVTRSGNQAIDLRTVPTRSTSWPPPSCAPSPPPPTLLLPPPLPLWCLLPPTCPPSAPAAEQAGAVWSS